MNKVTCIVDYFTIKDHKFHNTITSIWYYIVFGLASERLLEVWRYKLIEFHSFLKKHIFVDQYEQNPF